MTVRRSREAEEDLRKIGRYTRREHGRKQAERYLDALEEKFLGISALPESGKPVGRHLRALAHGPYQVLYRRTEDGVEIAGVKDTRREKHRQVVERLVRQAAEAERKQRMSKLVEEFGRPGPGRTTERDRGYEPEG